ncbi:MAG TPA: alpha/beta hydrolase [Usitatibacter sp.]|nr:alpha/beta hydrolase [Usitatibacter sp.]
MEIARARTPTLEVAYEQSGPAGGAPVVLLHGFPYDPRVFDGVVPVLNGAGMRTVVPYLRGFGPTRFLSAQTARAGQQGAIGQDLIELLDALRIEKALLAGFDWGARAACIVAALWPERVSGLVSVCGYQIQDISQAREPFEPEQERRFWYQYYFCTERGRAGLAADRIGISRLLWKLWSPTWTFDEAAFLRTARSFDNPDFIDVSIHSYRHRHAAANGDPSYAPIESRLASLPAIHVPSITIHGAEDGVHPAQMSIGHEKHFKASYERRVLEGIGHNPPLEAPREFAKAVLDLRAP